VGPHIRLQYSDRKTLADASNLLLHHAKRQTATAQHKEDRRKIKKLVEQFLPTLFFQQPSNGGAKNEDDDEPMEDVDNAQPGGGSQQKNGKEDKTAKDLCSRLEAVGGKNGAASSLRTARPLLPSQAQSAVAGTSSSSGTPGATSPTGAGGGSTNRPSLATAAEEPGSDPKTCPVNGDVRAASKVFFVFTE
jgi:hypothetical protein